MSERQRLTIVLIVVMLLLGVGLYRLYSQGRLPMSWSKLEAPSILQNNTTQTLVNEESAVIDTVEKTSNSVVAIGINQRIFNPFNPIKLCT